MTAVGEAQSAERKVSAWLDQFNAALEAKDAAAASDLFAITSFWRDLVALTWNIKTVESRRCAGHARAHPGGHRAARLCHH